MQLNPESLEVTSFQTSTSSTEPSTVILQDSAYPICIVYVSDCVSCVPDGTNAAL
ncbi:MAG TPA: hypothetical protein VF665_09095 [Longimicrobium sp.]|jgi:hypothetical protein|uniref:hypothetical protein n=1 Tax=Longimicrobium sp. TaxID=2029185 RepID=UPI002ED90E1A